MRAVLGVSVSGGSRLAVATREPAVGRAPRPARGHPRGPRRERRDRTRAPRVHAVLRAVGRRVGRHRVARLMRRAGPRGLAALPRRVRTTDSRHDHPIAPNRIGRRFEAAAPNQVWLGDPTYARTGEGWLFLAAVLDPHAREIVGWAMREALHAAIAVEAPEMAVQRQRPAPGFAVGLDRMATRWLTPPHRSRRPTRARAVQEGPGRGGHHAVDEPQRVVLGRRAHGELLSTRSRSSASTTASTPQGSRPGAICSRGSRAGHNTHRLHSALGYPSPAAAERRAA